MSADRRVAELEGKERQIREDGFLCGYGYAKGYTDVNIETYLSKFNAK
jgi:hypothetical protein